MQGKRCVEERNERVKAPFATRSIASTNDGMKIKPMLFKPLTFEKPLAEPRSSVQKQSTMTKKTPFVMNPRPSKASDSGAITTKPMLFSMKKPFSATSKPFQINKSILSKPPPTETNMKKTPFGRKEGIGAPLLPHKLKPQESPSESRKKPLIEKQTSIVRSDGLKKRTHNQQETTMIKKSKTIEVKRSMHPPAIIPVEENVEKSNQMSSVDESDQHEKRPMTSPIAVGYPNKLDKGLSVRVQQSKTSERPCTMFYPPQETRVTDAEKELLNVPTCDMTNEQDMDFIKRIRVIQEFVDDQMVQQHALQSRLLNVHVQLSECLLDVLTDLIAEHGGIGILALNQLTIN